MRVGRFVCVAAIGVLATTVARGQEPVSSRPSGGGSRLGLWDVEAMMEVAVKNISRRYNLNEQQEEYTRALMAKGVKGFLAEHEQDVRALLQEMLDKQFGSKEVTTETAKRWGEIALPMFYDAKKAIYDNNMEWREILNDDQKKIHDLDLRLMKGNFDAFEQRFERWKEGNYIKGELPFGSPSMPSAQQSTHTPPQIVRRMSPDTWQLYVKKFIDTYALDESQKTAAFAILNDCRDRAQQYLDARKDELARVEALEMEWQKTRDREKLRQANEGRRKLNEPVGNLFNELKERLEKIPTEAQRQAAGGVRPVKPAERDKARESKPATQPAQEPAQPPAGTPPPENTPTPP